MNKKLLIMITLSIKIPSRSQKLSISNLRGIRLKAITNCEQLKISK